jgi:hypothetical protein
VLPNSISKVSKIRQPVVGDWHCIFATHLEGYLSVSLVDGFLRLGGNWHGYYIWTCFEEIQKSSTHCKTSQRRSCAVDMSQNQV